jgi:MoaA/NifB/PqqE/SkfB family radical SAM enzyme
MIFNPQVKLALHREFISFCEGNNVFPISIELSISGMCQAACRRCPSLSFRNKEMMSTPVTLRLLDELYDQGTKSLVYVGGGEPTLHPDIKKIVKSCRIQQGMFTNALAEIEYDPGKLSFVRVTMTDREIPKENLKKIRRSARAGFRVNHIKGEEWKIEKAINLSDEYGYDYVQIVPALERGEIFTSETLDISKYKSKKIIVTDYKFDDQDKPREYTKCYGYNFVPFIWENGNVTTCAYIRDDSRFILGNINGQTLTEIINKAKPSVDVAEICQQCCKNHEINKLINNALAIEDKDFV